MLQAKIRRTVTVPVDGDIDDSRSLKRHLGQASDHWMLIESFRTSEGSSRGRRAYVIERELPDIPREEAEAEFDDWANEPLT